MILEMNKLRPRIALNLKLIRRSSGLSAGQVSKATGIPRGTILNYETCGSISEERLNQLAKYYGVKIEVLIGDTKILYDELHTPIE